MSEFSVPTTDTAVNRIAQGNPFPPDLDPQDGFPYAVRILTGSELLSGTRNNVFVELVGSKARTGRVRLTEFLSLSNDTANRGSYDDFLLRCKDDLGGVLVIVLENRKSISLPQLNSSWFVDFVICHDYNAENKQIFPCYSWIDEGDSISFTSNTTTLKDVEGNAVLKSQRQGQIDQRRSAYQWQKFEALKMPSAIDDREGDTSNPQQLPSDEQFGAVKSIDFTKDAITAVGKMVFPFVFRSMDRLTHYEYVAEAIKVPEFPTYQISRWVRDEEFGRQMLNGVNPVVIQKCSSIPTNFPVTNEMVKGSLVRGLSLEDEMKAGHVYICDLKIMDGLPCKDVSYCAAPLCLLYVDNNNNLVPIAIQLKQTPGSENPIFLPSDHWADWTLAKIYYQSAHNQFHQLSSHFLSCHAVMETYGVGTMRNLPDAHPVQKLLRPHFRYTMAINSRARESLINDGGIIDQNFAIGGKGKNELIRRAGAAYNIHWTNIKKNVEKRGVGGKELPGYYYRDDGMQLWQAIEHFVNDIINEFYSSDSDVKEDPELQSWANDLHINGFPSFIGSENSDGNGFPDTIKDKAQLVELCTLIIFTGSAQHAAINFGQYDMYSYVPNAPPDMRIPLPTSKGKADLQTLLNALPDRSGTLFAVALPYQLSQFSRSEQFLGHFRHERFIEEKVKDVTKRFQDKLAGIEGDILERNKTLDVPYVYLLPSRIPNSITI